jgi:hypothetical protein
MGAYVYKTKPSMTQLATVRNVKTGELSRELVSKYEFAYKPYNDMKIDDKLYNRYVMPASRAFSRAGKRPGRLGATCYEGRIDAENELFTTGGTTALSDSGFRSSGYKFVSWV